MKATPGILKYSRQVNIPKPNKIKQGRIKAADTRPLSVYSVLWRTYLTAWYQSPTVQTWITNTFVESNVVCGRFAETCEELIAEFTEALDEYGFGCALDFSQAFDKLDPALIAEIMLQTGLPQQLVEVLKTVWLQQHRVLQYDGESQESPLLTDQATPQGDPFGPLAMAIAMLAATREIDQMLKKKSPLQKKHMWMTGLSSRKTRTNSLIVSRHGRSGRPPTT